MPSRRTVNVGLLLALSTVLLIILHHNLLQSAGQADPARTSEGEWAQYEGQPVNLDPDVIPVVVCAVEERLGGTIATINSVRIHTNARLVFYIVTLRHTIPHITTWIKESVLENINYFIIEFNPDIVRGKIPVIAERPELLSPLNFARFYLGHLIPQHKRAVYLDDDIIVLGDIRELFESPLQDGHAAAFSDDCDAISTHLLANLRGIVVQNMYMAYLNYNKESVSKLGIRGSSCTFNPGVVVANLTEWRRQRISEQLEQWLLREQECVPLARPACARCQPGRSPSPPPVSPPLGPPRGRVGRWGSAWGGGGVSARLQIRRSEQGSSSGVPRIGLSGVAPPRDSEMIRIRDERRARGEDERAADERCRLVRCER
ncbi:glycosyltransferase 8 domain-containing protein 2-like isoform X1 [Petromyzon marinus]|uniref:glycosyltransferase 8 domain-containing protein 2-like isoform X1 n=1 Tax=Petromyzon marinus TaxID=7757 RepID=UPI003F6E5F7A